jgi:hypothetical protein
LTALDQRRPGGLLSSDDYGSSVEGDGSGHPLWRVLRSVAGRVLIGGALS